MSQRHLFLRKLWAPASIELTLQPTDKVFTDPVMKQVLSAGWQTVSYRQNTELFIEAWHWNPQGTWSDPAGRGYFVGNPKPGDFIRHSFGYNLPHRGFTRNDGNRCERLFPYHGR